MIHGKCLALALLLIGASSESSAAPADLPQPRYAVKLQKNVMVPMRDGVRLSTDVYMPQGAGDRLPAILVRTSYDKSTWRRNTFALTWPDVLMPAWFFAGQGYAVVVQDLRGRYESEGDFVFLGNDQWDGFDTTQWIANQPWSTGKVGTYGCSYLGEVQYQQAIKKNPHLVTMIPQAAGGASRHRAGGVVNGGVIELASVAGWLRSNGSKLRYAAPAGTSDEALARYAEYFRTQPVLPDVNYQDLWRSVPVIDMLAKLGEPPTDFEEIVKAGPPPTKLDGTESQGTRAAWWSRTGYIRDDDSFDVSALHVNSWYDYGVAETLQMFNRMRTNAASTQARDNQFAIISPVTHCRSEAATERTLVGHRDVGDARLDYFRMYLLWFDHWLKGAANGATQGPKLQLYVMGKNEWRGEGEWPLARTRFTKYFLHSGGKANSRFGDGVLEPTAPTRTGADRFVYDPRTPVPNPGGTPGPKSWALFDGATDQSSVELRNDVLVYSSPVLSKGIEITGPIHAVLYVSSSAPDTDFVAKLVDVYPDGTAYNLQEGILRARFREGYDRQTMMKPDEIYEIRIDLHATSNYFPAGHRIRLEVSSSNFPRFERNFNTGGKNFDETEGQIALNVIHHSNRHPSHVILPVIPSP